jgi:transposase
MIALSGGSADRDAVLVELASHSISQVILLTGPGRRRRWHDDDRRRILAAAFLPGAVVAEVARQYEFSTGLSYRWRRQRAEAGSNLSTHRRMIHLTMTQPSLSPIS